MSRKEGSWGYGSNLGLFGQIGMGSAGRPSSVCARSLPRAIWFYMSVLLLKAFLALQ